MKKIVSFLAQYYKGLFVFVFLFILFSLGNSYIQLRITIISQVAIDNWIENLPVTAELIDLSIRIFIMLIFTILFGMANRYIGSYLSSTVGLRIRKDTIARIFLQNPSILIMDESTSSLENQTEKNIQLTLEKLQKNRTTITVAHRLTTIVQCDKIVVLDEGKIIELERHSDLMEAKRFYYKLYQSGSL